MPLAESFALSLPYHQTCHRIMKTSSLLLSLLALCSLVLSSCAGGSSWDGDALSRATTPSPGKAMIVVYRTPGLAGKLSKPYIWINGRKMPGQLARGGFYAHEVSAGPAQVIFSWRDGMPSAGRTAVTALVSGPLAAGLDYVLGHEKISCVVQAQPGTTHYVLMDGVRLSEVTKEEGEEEIAECALLNPSGF